MKHPQLARAHHGGADGSGFEGLDFSVNTNPFGPNPILLEAARNADLERYPDSRYASLKAKLAAFHGLEPQNVVLGVGASELLHRVARSFVRANGLVLSVLPAFGEWERAVRLERGHLVTARADQALAMLAQIRPAVVYASRPNNPLGVSFAADVLIKLATWCERHGAVLVLDEAYAPFAPDLAPVPDSSAIIRLHSPGKAHGLVGLRLAYALAPTRLAAALENLAPSWVLPANTAAALEALPDARRYLIETVPPLLRLASDLAAQASRFVAVEHHGTPFMTLTVGDAPRLTGALLERGVRVRDCTSFGLPERIRVSAKLNADNAVLLAALETVLRG